jgi:hypothetical protein
MLEDVARGLDLPVRQAAFPGMRFVAAAVVRPADARRNPDRRAPEARRDRLAL